VSTIKNDNNLIGLWLVWQLYPKLTILFILDGSENLYCITKYKKVTENILKRRNLTTVSIYHAVNKIVHLYFSALHLTSFSWIIFTSESRGWNSNNVSYGCIMVSMGYLHNCQNVIILIGYIILNTAPMLL
jgi:hypothetical protein